MRNGVVVRSNASQPSRYSASSAIAATTNSALTISTAEGATIGTATAMLLRSDRTGRFPLARTAAHPALSSGTRSRLSLNGLGATRGLPAAAPAPRELPPPELPPPELSPPELSPPELPPKDETPSAPEPTERLDEPTQDAPTAAVKPTKPQPIEMAIDSLPNFDLLQPIPVIIEALDNRMFSAEAPALEIAATGSSIGGAFLQLKEQIAATYEQCRQKSTLTPDRLRQMGLFQAYIGKSKRGWSLGRG